MRPFVKLYLLTGPVDHHLGYPFFSLYGILLRTKKVFTHETDRKPGGVRIPEKHREGKEVEFRASGKLTKSLTE